MKQQHNTTNPIVRRFKVKGVVLACATAALLAPAQGVLWAGSSSFFQTDWSGGPSGATAVAPGDLSGWSNYAAKDGTISAGSMLSVSSGTTGAMGHKTAADFGIGAVGNTQITHSVAADFDTTGASFIDAQANAGALGIKPASMAPSWEPYTAWDMSGITSTTGVALAALNADFADLDSDGDLDMVVGGKQAGLSDQNAYTYWVVRMNSGSDAAPNWDTQLADGWYGGCCTRGPNVPILEDFDDDGLVDLFLGIRTTTSGKVLGFKNSGTDTAPQFSRVSGWDKGSDGNVNNLMWSDMADLDNDGDLDLMVGGNSESNAFAYLSSGISVTSATWSYHSAFDTPNFGSGIQPRIADLTGDGLPDILAGFSGGDSHLRGFTNIGSLGSPAWTQNITGPDSAETAATYADYVSMGDFDNDGDQDLLISGSDSTTLKGYRNIGTVYNTSATYTSAVLNVGESGGYLTTLSANTQLPSGAALSIDLRGGNTPTPDVNWSAWETGVEAGGDISVLGARKYIQYRVNLSTSNTAVTPLLLDVSINYTPVQSSTNLIYDDGVFLKPDSRTISWARNSGWEYTFSEPAGSTKRRPAPVMYDYDDDGLLDLLITNEGGTNAAADWVQVKNQGSLTAPDWSLAGTGDHGWLDFSGSGRIPGNSSWTPAVADLDGDGDVDMLMTNSGTLSADGYRNVGAVGAPVWNYEPAFDVGNYGGSRPYAGAGLADLDGDGDIDFIHGFNNGDSTPWRNIGATLPGDPEWQVLKSWDNPPVNWGVDGNLCGSGDYVYPTFADLDSDGDYDLVAGCNSNIVARENTGDETFPVWPSGNTTAWHPTDEPSIGTYFQPYLADIDNDGDPDIVAGTRRYEQRVYVFENTSDSLYPSSGSFNSGILDAGSVTVDYTTLDYMAVVPGSSSLTVEVRGGNTALPDVTWSNWSTVADGGSLDAFDGKRYLQYRVTMTPDTSNVSSHLTPKFKRIFFNYLDVPAEQSLISSPVDSGVDGNYITALHWSELLMTNTDVRVQLRTSSDNVSWSDWMGPDGTNAGYFNSAATHGGGCSGSGAITCTAMPGAVKDGSGDRWFQYKVTLVANGANAPVLADISVDMTDTLPPGLLLGKNAVNTSEAGGSDSFSVALTSQPVGTVTIDLAVDPADEVNLSTTTLQFDGSDWGSPKTVNVTPVDDLVDDGDVNYSITLSIDQAQTDDADYDALADQMVTGVNADNDTAGFHIQPGSTLNTTEAGASAQFTVALTSKPLVDVVLPISSSDTSEGTTSVSSLTFTPADYGTRTVIVSGVDDGADDGDVNYSIVTGPAQAVGDANYHNADPVDVAAVNVDDDSTAVLITPYPAGDFELTTTEAGGKASFEVTLGSQPTSPVTIQLATTDGSEGVVSPTSITLDGDDWNTPHTVTVTGQEDSLTDGDVYYSVTLSATTSGDESYDGLVLPYFTVKNTDNDTAALLVTPQSGLTTTEAGGTAQFSVRLATAPSASVRVRLSSDNPDEGLVSPVGLDGADYIEFTGFDWQYPRSVTIDGVQDAVSDGDQAYSVTVATATGGDAAYNAVSPVTVSLTNQDDEAGATLTDSAFSQSDWRGGDPENADACLAANGLWIDETCIARDPDNQSGWQAYSSKSAEVELINLGADLTLPLSEQSYVADVANGFDMPVTGVTHNRARHFENGSFSDAKLINAFIGLKPNTPTNGAEDITTADWEEMPAWNFQDTRRHAFPVFADLDDDGDLDMVSGGGYRPGSIKVYRNDGTSLTSHAKTDWVEVPEWGMSNIGGCCGGMPRPTLADFDGDGDYDLFYGRVTTTAEYKIYAYENIGTRSEVQWIRKSLWDLNTAAISGDQLGSNYLHPALADIDNDGRYEMLIGGPSSNGQSVYAYEYDFQFSSWSVAGQFDTPSVSGTWSTSQRNKPRPSLGDLDNDGDLDMMLGWSCGSGGSCGPSIDGFENEGTAQNPSWVYNLAAPPNDTQSQGGDSLADYNTDYVSLVDIDNDGDLDMFANAGNLNAYEALPAHGELVGYRNNSSSYPASGRYTSAVIDSGWPGGFGVIDFTTETPTGTAIELQVRAGNAADTADASWDTGWWTINSGDDLADAAFGGAFDGKRYLQYRVNFSSEGSATPLLTGITVNYGTAYPAATDMVASHGALSLSMTRSVAWQYRPSWNHPLPAGDATTPALADMDGDGDTDMIVARSSQDGKDWFAVRNIGTTEAPLWQDLPADESWFDGFDLKKAASGSYTKFGLANALVDIDRDGDPDMFWANEHTVDGHVYAFENIGSVEQPAWQRNANWAMKDERITANKTRRKLSFADLDNDGDADAATSVVWDTSYLCPGDACNVIVWRNNQSAANNPAWQYLPITKSPNWGMNSNWELPGYNTNKPEFFDIDGDGDYDLLVGGPTNQIHAVENVGTKKAPAWQRRADWDVDLSAQGTGGAPYPFSADLDNDGDYDLLLGGSGGVGTVYAYENSSVTDYATSGSFVSDVIDVGSHLGFTTLSYEANVRPGTVLRVDLRSGPTAVPDTSWSDWQNGISSGVTDNISGHGSERYVQYRVYMESSGDGSLAPELTRINIGYNAVVRSAELVSNPYNTTDAQNAIKGIGWSETLSGDTEVRVQLRTAADNGGAPGSWSEWQGPDGTADSYWNSANTFNGACSGSDTILCTNVPGQLDNGTDNQWLQYKVILVSAGVEQPKLADIAVFYDSVADGSAKVSVSTTTLATDESGGSANFYISLASAPSADVSINLNSGDLSEGTLSDSSVTFSAGSTGPLLVTVTGVDDEVRDGDIDYTLFTSATSSAAPAFDNLSVADISVTNSDDDTASGGIQVSAPSGYQTSESGASVSFTVELASRPQKDVIVLVESSDADEALLTKSSEPARTIAVVSLRFTSGNWSTPQTVTVTGQDENIADGDAPYTVMIRPAISEDPNYAGLDPADIELINSNDDSAGMVLSVDNPDQGFVTSESGAFSTFHFKLTSQPDPGNEVSVKLSSSDMGEGYTFLRTYKFDSTNWDVNQSITVAGASDGIQDDDVEYQLVTDVTGVTGDGSDGYSVGMSFPDFTLTNLDIDTPGVVVTPTSGLITTENGGIAYVKVALTSAPSHDVFLNVSSSDPSEGYVTERIVFTPSAYNWRGVTLKITGVDDAVVDGDMPYTIVTEPLVSADPDYNGVDPDDISVVNLSTNVKSNGSGQGGAAFGRAVAFIGDINGDGRDDLAAGAPYFDDAQDSGRVEIYTGNSSGYIGSAAQFINGAQMNDHFGAAIAPLGDLNNDGYDDVLIGAPGAGVGGEAYIFHGSAAGLVTPAVQTLTMNTTAAEFGSAVASAGDVNNDGHPDLIVGAKGLDRAYVYHGDGTAVSTSADSVLVGQSGSRFGISVAGAGDVNGDHFDDVIVGAELYSASPANEGGAFVFHGSGAGVETAFAWSVESDQADARYGHAVAGVGDVNGDGFADVAVGAPGYDNGQSDEGVLFIYHGSASGLPGSADKLLEMDQAGAAFATAVAAAGDANRDGYADLVVGAVGYDNSETDEGRVLAYFGSVNGIKSTPDLEYESNQSGANLGVAVSGGGYFDADLFPDLAAGADLYDDTQTDEGRLFLYRTPALAPGITVTPTTGLETGEQGGRTSFDVVLDTPPGDQVVVELFSGDASEGRLSKLLFFTPANWNEPQRVYVYGEDDDIDDGDVFYNAVWMSRSNDLAYDDLDGRVSLVNRNDDYSVYVTAGDMVAGEAGPDAGMFTFSRTGDVSGDLGVDYTLGGTASNGSDYSALSESIVIPAGQSSIDLMVTPVDDAIVDRGETVTVTLDSGSYLIGGSGSAALTIVDNDAPGITVIQSDNLTTNEANGSAQFSVVLDTQPAAPVTIAVSSDNDAEGQVQTAQLSFDSGNWHTPQSVTVIGQDDDTVDGDVAYSVELSAASSADSDYNGIDPDDVALINADDDVLPTVAIGVDIASVNEAAQTPAKLIISRSGDTSAELNVDYVVSGSATPGSDYETLGATVTIPAGAASVELPVYPLNDSELESADNGRESIVVQLDSGSGYLVAQPAGASVFIRDDEYLDMPVVNFGVDQHGGEGGSTTVDVYLNKEAYDYPVLVPYSVAGSSDATDHDAVNGTIEISSGRHGTTSVNIHDDGFGDSGETITFTMGVPTNANAGDRNTHTITIVEENVSPDVDLTVIQGGTSSRLIATGNGFVTISSDVSDANPSDNHSYDWGATNPTLLAVATGTHAPSFEFDPTTLATGYYKAKLTVNDDGVIPQSTDVEILIQVTDATPQLSANDDSDGDGIFDQNESYDDSDNDGIADYLDSDTLAANELPLFAADPGAYIARTDAGLTLRLGDTAFAADADGVLVSEEEILAYGGGEGSPGAYQQGDSIPNSGGYFDFEIAGLPKAGQSVNIVIPQLDAIPNGAVYRKYHPDSGWQDYVIDADNSISSAPGLPGDCPLPGDVAYTPGLNEGHHCIQLTLQDGGANDMDGVANHVIEDPAQLGAVKVAVADTSDSAASSSGSGGGGFSILWLLLCFGLAGYRKRLR